MNEVFEKHKDKRISEMRESLPNYRLKSEIINLRKLWTTSQKGVEKYQ